jgi:hypothetical protein
MQIIKEIYLDFYQSEPVLVTAKQGDNVRFIKIILLDNGSLFSVPAGATASLARGAVWNACVVNSDGSILAPITADMSPGRFQAEIEVYSGTEKLSTWNFVLAIQASARDDSAIEGTNDYTQLEATIQWVHTTLNEALQALHDALEGTVLNDDVISEITTYSSYKIEQEITNIENLIGERATKIYAQASAPSDVASGTVWIDI